MPANHNTGVELPDYAARGFRKDIREIAHRDFDAIDAATGKKAEPLRPIEARGQTVAEDRDPHSTRISSWEPRRPSGGYFPLPAKKACSRPLPRPGAFPERVASSFIRARRPERSRDGLSPTVPGLR